MRCQLHTSNPWLRQAVMIAWSDNLVHGARPAQNALALAVTQKHVQYRRTHIMGREPDLCDYNGEVLLPATVELACHPPRLPWFCQQNLMLQVLFRGIEYRYVSTWRVDGQSNSLTQSASQSPYNLCSSILVLMVESMNSTIQPRAPPDHASLSPPANVACSGLRQAGDADNDAAVCS